MNVQESLMSEGLREDQITYENDIKIENENGFMSYRLVHGYPYVTHFFINADKRNGYNALDLFLIFKKQIKEFGFDHFIAEVIPGKEIFEKFFKACLRCPEPYAIENGNKYYFIEVR